MSARKRATWTNFKKGFWSIVKEHIAMIIAVLVTWSFAHYFVENNQGVWPIKSGFTFVEENLEKVGGVAGLLTLISVVVNWLRDRK